MAAERAIALDPAMPEGFANLGHACNVLERTDEALAAFQQALNLRPHFPDALKGLARAQRNDGRPSSGIVALLRAAELSPRAPGLHFELASLYQEIGELHAARLAIETAMNLSGGISPLASNALMGEQYDPDINEADTIKSARRWGHRQISLTRPVARQARVQECVRPKTGAKLKIGYVSADLYRHPVGWLGAGPISAHNRAAFHVTVYANQTCADWVTGHVKASVDSWVPILGLDDDTVAARIAADEIDILVDLSGHTAGNRLSVFARRPAPVQVTWLGYFATTGLPTMDYVLLDEDHLIPGAEALFTEHVIRLPNCRFCYLPPRDAPAVAPAPSAASGRVTFGSFNNAAKINRHVIALWSQVLNAVADSTLLLKWRSFTDPLLQARLRSAFSAHGIDPDRIRFDGHTLHEDMLRQYAEIDIALDPFPFSGGLTSCEALWMGVPVMTLPGPRPVSRQTHAILKTIGHADWSMASAAAFLETTVALAQDEDGLAVARSHLRQDMQASPLCDAKQFAADLEAVFHKLKA